MTDEEIERIYEEGAAAGRDDWRFGRTPCPYPVGGEEAEVWDGAYRNSYASENGR